MTPKSRIVFALAVISLFALPAAVSGAGTEKRISVAGGQTSITLQEDLLLAPGDYKAYVVHLRPIDKMTVTVKVLDNTIDVYTMRLSDYDDYKASASPLPNPGYLQEYSKENMKYLEYPSALAPAEEGDYVVIVDNAHKTVNGAPGNLQVTCSINVKIELAPPFPWGIVGGAIVAVIVVAVFVLFMLWKKNKKQELDEAEKNRKRAEAAKMRPIFLPPPPPPGYSSGPAPGAPSDPSMGQVQSATPLGVAPPPSSTCKACPHIYDATAANCIACDNR